MAELDCCLLAIVQCLQIRALLKCELQKLIGVRRRSVQWSTISTSWYVTCRSRPNTASNAAIVESTLLCASRSKSFACDKLTSAKLKSRVDLSLFFVNSLICCFGGLPGAYVLLCHFKQRLGLKSVEECLVSGKNYIFGSGKSIRILCLFLKL
jgi:hypothetical protein